MLLTRRVANTMGSAAAAAAGEVAELDRRIQAVEDAIRSNTRAQRELGPKLQLDVTPGQRQALEAEYAAIGSKMTAAQQRLRDLRRQRDQAVAAAAAARDADELARLRAAEAARATAEGSPEFANASATPSGVPVATPAPVSGEFHDDDDEGGMPSRRTLLIGGAVAGAVVLIMVLRPRSTRSRRN